ncbi:MAG: hypothetical protein ABJD11_08065 [Gemmatimonadota bacterium]
MNGGEGGEGRDVGEARRMNGGGRRGIALFALLLVCGFSPLAAQGSTSLTIYNDGRVLVRRTLPLEVPKGTSSQHLVLGALDPSTIFSLDSSVSISAATYDGAVDYQSVIRRAIGRTLVFRTGSTSKDTVSATVLGVDPERYKLADGTVSFQAPGTPRFPAELVVVDPTVTLALHAPSSRKEIRLGYFTSGAQWQASYQLLLGSGNAASGSGQLTGAAVITAGTIRAEDAEIQLLAGAVSRAGPSDQLQRQYAMAARAPAAEMDAKMSEQKVGEFHLYSLPGRTTLLPGLTSSVALFDPATVKYTRTFEARGQIPYWGALQQFGEETDVPVEITYVVQRALKTEFGDRPLAGGVAHIYQADSGGRHQLVGESSLDHTPAGEDLHLNAGTAFDVTAKRLQTSYVSRRDSAQGGGWRYTATADYQVTLKNAGAAAVSVDVLEQRAGEWSVVSSSIPPQKVSSTLTRFRVPVPAGGQAVLKYRVKVIW